MDMPNEYKKGFYGIGIVLLVILSVYFAVGVYQDLRYSGSENLYETISVSGFGEVNSAPDVASIYFTLQGSAKTVAEAQGKVAEQEAKALEVLRANAILDADIKTTNASFNPKYEYVYTSMVPCGEFGCPPRPGKNVVTGYEAYETITVKVRAIDSAGKVIEELGKAGVTQLSGPNFDIDDKDGLKAEARRLAIEDAQAKAKVLAKDLGVSLKGVSSFYEQEENMYPMMYDGAMMKAESSVRAELPKGENTITSNVTITYRIR